MGGRSVQAAHGWAVEDAERRGWLCFYCGITMVRGRRYTNGVTADHRVSRARGGERSKENIVAACWSCNHGKGDMSEAEWCAVLAMRGGMVAAIRRTHPHGDTP